MLKTIPLFLESHLRSLAGSILSQASGKAHHHTGVPAVIVNLLARASQPPLALTFIPTPIWSGSLDTLLLSSFLRIWKLRLREVEVQQSTPGRDSSPLIPGGDR